MARIFLFILLFIFYTVIFSQGYVENGSFEITSGKIKNANETKKITDWHAIGTVNIFSKNAKEPQAQTSNNFMGSEEPSDGENYIGICIYAQKKLMDRGFIFTKLKKTLSAGKNYCIKMEVALAEASGYATNSLSFAFAKEEPNANSPLNFISNPQFIIAGNATKTLDNTDNWEEVCIHYTAKGNEAYLIIGNFLDDKSTKTVKVKKPKGSKIPQKQIVYYFIDNVKIEDEGCLCRSEVKAQEEELTIKHVYRRAIGADYKKEGYKQLKEIEVYFKEGSSNIDPIEKEKLNLVAQILTENKDIKINIKGYACGESEDINLAYERSQKVFLGLKVLNVDESQIINAKDGEYTRLAQERECINYRKVIFVVLEK